VITVPTDTFENDGSYEIIDGEVKVIIKHVGGHTVDSLYVYSSTYKTLFAGDNLFVDSHPYGGHSSCNPDKWMDVFKEILSLDIEIIIPGHGPVTDKSYVEKELAKFEEMKKIMKQLVKDGKSDEEVKGIILNQFFPPEDSEDSGDSIFRESTVIRFYDYWINGVE
ncbi:MAG: MBL fold metallo-hydrolase, partial [Candidatus Heimdallarchaeota archaeon]